jgi:hypothetical protein
MATTEKTKLSMTLGQELFRFETFQQWVNKAPSWYATSGLSSCKACGDVRHAVAVDAAGRICRNGAQFMRARDDGSFPVAVYLFDPDQAPPPEGERTKAVRREVNRRLGGGS